MLDERFFRENASFPLYWYIYSSMYKLCYETDYKQDNYWSSHLKLQKNISKWLAKTKNNKVKLYRKKYGCAWFYEATNSMHTCFSTITLAVL